MNPSPFPQMAVKTSHYTPTIYLKKYSEDERWDDSSQIGEYRDRTFAENVAKVESTLMNGRWSKDEKAQYAQFVELNP